MGLHIASTRFAFLMACTAAFPALAQDAPVEDVFLGTLVLDTINDGGLGVTNAEAANSAGSRVPADPSTLPRAVTVLPRELFEAQGARTMEEAVAYSPGIVTETYGQDNRYDEYVLRGFEAQIGGTYRDGMPLRTLDWASWRTEPFGLESVNILRGPTSDLYGTNQPGGLINGVTKRPRFTYAGTVRGVATSDGGTELGVDFTGPLSDSVAYRFVGLLNKSGSVYDAVDTGRIYFAPSLTFSPSDDTTLTVYGQYQKDDVGDSYVLVPQYGSLRPNSVARYGPGTYTGNPNKNTIETTQNYIGYEFEQRVAPSLSFVSRARVSDNDWRNRTDFPAAFVNLSYLLGAPAGLPTDINAAVMTKFDVDQTLKQNSFDNALIYEINTARAKGSLAFGIDHFDVRSTTDFGYGYAGERNLITGAVTGFLAATVPANFPARRVSDLKQTGIYVNGNVEIDDRFILNGGLRHDSIDYNQRGFTTGLAGVVAFNNTVDENFTSANIGLGYRITPELLVYGSVARSFNLPPSGTTSTGARLDLEAARSFELGLKFTSADGHTGFNASVFDITKTNVAFDDPASGNPLFFTQIGQVRSRGVEFEVTHDFQNGLSVFGGLTYVDAEVTRDAVFGGNRPARAPKVSAAIFAQYEVPQVDGLALGVGVRHTGSRFSDIGNTLEMSSVTLLDASLTYEVNDWNIQLSGRNLADKEYIGYCGGAFLPLGSAALDSVAGSCVYGAGREISLSVQRNF
ncbi:MAG: TonB-dependent siderophore receptor [Pseudomonadota bacterium]